MNDSLHQDLLTRLADFSFRQVGAWLRSGLCPSCGKKEVYTHADHPWVLRCGRLSRCAWEGHVKELYPDLFENWSQRYPATEQSAPNAAADAYMQHARGFDLAMVSGWYRQETYFDARLNAGSATVRFPVGSGYWERLIDRPARFGKKKARFQPGSSYVGQWWQPPTLDVGTAAELWLVEGIFDAIALRHHDLSAVALLSCNNYPEQTLADLAKSCEQRGLERPALVWALDGDPAGQRFIRKGVVRARAAGWTCRAAQVPQRGRGKLDWNDLHLRDRHPGERAERNFSADGLQRWLYHGAVLVAQSASEKALLIYNHLGGRTPEFDFAFDKRLYWFKLDLERYNAARHAQNEIDGGVLADDEKRAKALEASHAIRPIANCWPTPLYFQENKITDESWYYFRVAFPHDGAPVKNTFTSSQLSAAAEFKKRLLGIAPGAVFSGTSTMLERMMERQLFNIKRVETVDFIGYSREHGCYVLGDVAVKDGMAHAINDEDFFDIGRLSVKSLNQSVSLTINADRHDYRQDWVGLLWRCFGAKGLAALTFWFGALFAEQIRAEQKSFPFLEVVGEAGSGKSTLIEFLWKLFGRRDYEGFDPSKSSLAARARNFAQVSGLPVVLIESDRERLGDDKSHVKSFDWDELKTAYNGRSVRARGMATGGNETYEPPFRGAIVISQNNEVSASDAILQRIVHLNFDKANHTPASREAATLLEGMPADQVSGFILAATEREGQITTLVGERFIDHEAQLHALPEIKSTRIAKNHAQLLALADALRLVVTLSDDQQQALHAQITAMAVERQQAINADHPIVQEFWEAFDYLDGDGYDPRLNHSRDPEVIAVNLNHFVFLAGDRRQQIPLLRDLKTTLKTSRVRKYLGQRTVNSGILARDGARSSTIRCWVFQRG